MPTDPPDDQPMFDFEREFQAGENGAAVAWERTRDEWRADALLFLERLRPGATVTSDDVVRAVGLPSKNGNNNAMGALFKAALSMKLIQKTRTYVPSARMGRHGNAVAVWERLF